MVSIMTSLKKKKNITNLNYSKLSAVLHGSVCGPESMRFIHSMTSVDATFFACFFNEVSIVYYS